MIVENNYLISCSCPDTVRLCKHIFLVNITHKIPYYLCSLNSTNSLEDNQTEAQQYPTTTEDTLENTQQNHPHIQEQTQNTHEDQESFRRLQHAYNIRQHTLALIKD